MHKDLSPCWESVHKDLTSTLCEDTIVASMLLLYGAGRSMLLLTLLRSSRCMLLLLTLYAAASHAYDVCFESCEDAIVFCWELTTTNAYFLRCRRKSTRLLR